MEDLQGTAIGTEVYTGITEEVDNVIELKIASAVFKYYSPVQLSIALFGNFMIILVFSRKSLRHSVTSFLFRVLAVADTNMVLVALVPEAVLELGNSSMPYSSNTRCKVHAYLYFAGRSFAVWVLLVIVLERFIGVNFPHKASILINRRRAKISLFLIFITVYLLYSMVPFFIKSAVVRNEEGEIINYHCDMSHPDKLYFTDEIFPLYDSCIYTLIPFILMTCANVSIIYRLVQSQRMKMRTSTTNVSGDVLGMTAMLLGVSFGFIACALPYTISKYQRQIHGLSDPGTYLFWALSTVLANMNHCINFYIYCLTGSRFREEIRKMFECPSSQRTNVGQPGGLSGGPPSSHRATVGPPVELGVPPVAICSPPEACCPGCDDNSPRTSHSMTTCSIKSDGKSDGTLA